MENAKEVSSPREFRNLSPKETFLNIEERILTFYTETFRTFVLRFCSGLICNSRAGQIRVNHF